MPNIQLRSGLATFAAGLLLALPVQAAKPKVVILATGGTIAGSAESQTQAGYASGQVGVDVLLGAVPQIADLAAVSGEQVANVGSQDMSDAIWLQLAARVNELQNDSAVDGIVITHGTDTIEETGDFLHLTVRGRKPVVLPAAMRPSTALSADGPLNLYNAVAVAADPAAAGKGVLIVANDDIHGARGITKTSTTDVETFLSPERGLIGVSLYGKNRYFRGPYRTHTADSEFSLDDVTELPRVDVIYVTADVSPDLIDAAVAAGARGLVTAGVGNGNMNAATLDAAQKAIEQGIVVVRSTRVPTGYVIRNGEVNDDKFNTIASDDLNPPKARVLLMLCLTGKRSLEEIQEIFIKY